MLMGAYIGDLQSPEFSWEHGNWSRNIPRKLIGFLPCAHTIWRNLIAEIDRGNENAKQTDWGAYVICLTPMEIENFLLKTCDIELNEQVKNDLQLLDMDKKYGLVVFENA